MARTVAATAVGARSLICVNPSRTAHPMAGTRAGPTADIMGPRATADRVLRVMEVVDIPMEAAVVIPAAAAADTPEVGATEAAEVTVAVVAIDRVRDIAMSRSGSKLL